jgi:hypothetical protein
MLFPASLPLGTDQQLLRLFTALFLRFAIRKKAMIASCSFKNR